jgi:hypothetical protein
VVRDKCQTGKAVKKFMTMHRWKCGVNCYLGECLEDYLSMINYWEQFCGMNVVIRYRAQVKETFIHTVLLLSLLANIYTVM